jgi:threonine/homoserine/homoserine lactone efflux protein
MIAFPIPVPADTPPIVGILFGIAAIVGFAVLIWQAVRYFRNERDNDNDPGDGDDR